MARRFLVVESDTLGRDDVGANFRWMRDKVGLKLRAIVDTAAKVCTLGSNTPGFDCRRIKAVLPELGLRSKVITASQPVRLPGALRVGKYQRLVYLASEVANEFSN